eukprot:TRINITY_DN24333_c0_g1_i1.p1 TRINITY_DN24333_c0_g1~~TRINITY_DN24333_c0_g1_i1.p1  ORF type:complete len:1305 (+),score=336.70 TRINITY_DN24333_c0_g1_i1:88-3915(+)
MAAARVAKLAQLLDGGPSEQRMGLRLLEEELDQDGAADLVVAFRDASPSLGELVSLLNTDHAPQAAKCFRKMVDLGGTMLTQAATRVVTQSLATILKWIQGARGIMCCGVGLDLLASISAKIPALLPGRLNLAQMTRAGPWVGFAEEGTRRKGRATYDRQLRDKGIDFLLSFLLPIKEQRGDMTPVDFALRSAGFFQTLTRTMKEDPEPVLRRIVETVCAMLCSTKLSRSLRAVQTDRGSLLSGFSYATAAYPEWAEEPVARALVALRVPEDDFALAAPHPNRALINALKTLAPARFRSHRQILRRCIHAAPDCAAPLLTHARMKDALITPEKSDAEVLFAVDAILAVLDGRLPLPLRQGWGRLAVTNAEVELYFDITPDVVGELCFPTVLRRAMQPMCRRKSPLLAMQVMTCTVMALRRLCQCEEAIQRIAARHGDAATAAKAAEFVTELRLRVTAALPAPEWLLNFRAPPPAYAAAALPQQAAYLHERVLLALRLMQDRLPQKLAGMHFSQLFPCASPSVAEAHGDPGAALEKVPTALGVLSHRAAYLLLQLLTNNAVLDYVNFRAPMSAASEGGKLVAGTSKLTDIVARAVQLQSDPDPEAAKVAEACIGLVHALVASVCCVPAACPGGIPPSRAVCREFVLMCRTIADAQAAGNTLRALADRLKDLPQPFGSNRAITLEVAARSVEKQGAQGWAERVGEALKRGAAAPPQEELPNSIPAQWSLPEAPEQPEEAPRPRRRRDPLPQAADDTEPVPDSSAWSDKQVLRRYGGTFSRADRALWPRVRELLPRSGYQAGPGASIGGRVQPLWFQTGLPEHVGSWRALHALERYPLEPEASAPDPDIPDPRYVTASLAAHLAHCAKRWELGTDDGKRIVGFDPRRIALTGLLSMLLFGLASRDEEVRRQALGACACLLCLMEQGPQTALHPLILHVRNSILSPGAPLPVFIAAFFAHAARIFVRPGHPAYGAVTSYVVRQPQTVHWKPLPLSDAPMCPQGPAYEVSIFFNYYVRSALASLALGTSAEKSGEGEPAAPRKRQRSPDAEEEPQEQPGKRHKFQDISVPEQYEGHVRPVFTDGVAGATIGVMTTASMPGGLRELYLRVIEALPRLQFGSGLRKALFLLPALTTLAAHPDADVSGELRAVGKMGAWDRRSRCATLAGAICEALPQNRSEQSRAQKLLSTCRDSLLIVAEGSAADAVTPREGSLTAAAICAAAAASRHVQSAVPKRVIRRLRAISKAEAVAAAAEEGEMDLKAALRTLSRAGGGAAADADG